MVRYAILIFILVLAGCGTSSIGTSPGAGSLPTTVFGSLDDLAGGSLALSSGHSVTFSANSLSQDTDAILALLPQHLPAQPHPDFLPVGEALEVDLGPATLTGEVSATIPFTTQSPQTIRVYWQLSDDVLYPLETSYDATQQAFSATVPADLVEQLAAFEGGGDLSLAFGLLDESDFLNRPDHVDWPSYNLYVFENGGFVKYLDQGQPVPGRNLPPVGDEPLMVVHGLGSNSPNFNQTVSNLMQSRSYSRVYGFEYDTLSSIATTGPRLREAYSLIEQGAGRDWQHLAHSMGCVVSRQAIENGGPLSYRSNNVVMAAGPHTGSLLINALQKNTGRFNRFITMLVVNNVMDFRNADGTPCKVSLTDAGFIDLADGSAALATLNNGASGRHPKEAYRTLAGNRRSYLLWAANALVGVYLDDGLVDVASANPGGLIGVVQGRTVPNNHLDITTDARGRGVILEYFAR